MRNQDHVTQTDFLGAEAGEEEMEDTAGWLTTMINKGIDKTLSFYSNKPVSNEALVDGALGEIEAYKPSEKEKEDVYRSFERGKVRALIGGRKISGTDILKKLRKGHAPVRERMAKAILSVDADTNIRFDCGTHQHLRDAWELYSARFAVDKHNHEQMRMDFDFVLEKSFETLGDLASDATAFQDSQ